MITARAASGTTARTATVYVGAGPAAKLVAHANESQIDFWSNTGVEAAVQDALSQALAGRTSLVIAHRLSTITDADRILVLDDGRLVEQGKHQELLDADGLYADLYRTLVRTEA